MAGVRGRMLRIALIGLVAGACADARPPEPAASAGDAGPGPDGAAPGSDGRSVRPLGQPSWTTTVRVLAISYDPILENRARRPLTRVMGWRDPRALAEQYAADVAEATGGTVRYEVTGWLDEDTFPPKVDGFTYDEESYLACLDDPGRCHDPDTMDYAAVLGRFDICGRVERGEIDEVWIFGGPYFGLWESTMAGDGAFFLNSVPVPDYPCRRRFVVMGFSPERDVAEMLHNLGHRVEFTMMRVFRNHPGSLIDRDPFSLFRRSEALAPGAARCGDTHHPPNAAGDYDYANERVVEMSCDAYLDYPNLDRPARAVDCSEWGCTHRGYMKWWFAHVPRNPGSTGVYLHNWWKYVFGYEAFLSDCGRAVNETLCRTFACQWAPCGHCIPPEADAEAACEREAPAPGDCAALDDIAACDARRDECAWYICAEVCRPRGTPVDEVCGAPAGGGERPCEAHDTVGACDAHADRCAWYACADRCLPRGTPVDEVCGGAAPPTPCATVADRPACEALDHCRWLDCAGGCRPSTADERQACGGEANECAAHATVEACDAHGQTCAWYACARACYRRGTPNEAVCGAERPDPGPGCDAHRDRETCDAHRDVCAWYLCAEACHPRGTPVEQVCPDPPARCDHPDARSCDMHAADCAWYACADACLPRGTPIEQACPEDCRAYGDIERCDAHADRCAWYACANACHPRGTPVEAVCPEGPAPVACGDLPAGDNGDACEGVPDNTWRCACSARQFPGRVVSQVCRDGVWQTFNVDPADCSRCRGNDASGCAAP